MGGGGGDYRLILRADGLPLRRYDETRAPAAASAPLGIRVIGIICLGAAYYCGASARKKESIRSRLSLLRAISALFHTRIMRNGSAPSEQAAIAQRGCRIKGAQLVAYRLIFRDWRTATYTFSTGL